MRCYDYPKLIGQIRIRIRWPNVNVTIREIPIIVFLMATRDEMQMFWHWFHEWDAEKRRIFLEKLVPKITPNKLFAMAELMGFHSTNPPEKSSDCKTFGDQLMYFHSRLDQWTAEEANGFLGGLEVIDESAMDEFYAKVASTVEEP